jgi:DNA-binding NarL/FixJ family response regulator
MPEVGGLDVLPEIQAIAPRCKVVVHSAIGAMFMTESALRAGAVAYIEKGVSPRSIVAHLNRVADAGTNRPVRPYPLNREYPDN